MGWAYIGTGIIPIVIVLAVIISAIVGDTAKHRQAKPPRTKVLLVDAMYGGLDARLAEIGCEAQSVRKLCAEGLPMRSDFSVLKYAEKYGMILVTNDRENIAGCEENGIPCISSGKSPSADKIIRAVRAVEGS